MESFDIAEISSSAPVPVLTVDESCPNVAAIRMRALRRKARRISAYVRFNVDTLNALALAVETDLATLQH